MGRREYRPVLIPITRKDAANAQANQLHQQPRQRHVRRHQQSPKGQPPGNAIPRPQEEACLITLLIHYVGFMVVNSAVPPHIGSADSYFLSLWYAAFASVDLIALHFARLRIRHALAISFAWSATLSIEALTLHDNLQRCDWFVQIAIDCILFVLLISELRKTKLS